MPPNKRRSELSVETHDEIIAKARAEVVSVVEGLISTVNKDVASLQKTVEKVAEQQEGLRRAIQGDDPRGGDSLAVALNKATSAAMDAMTHANTLFQNAERMATEISKRVDGLEGKFGKIDVRIDVIEKADRSGQTAERVERVRGESAVEVATRTGRVAEQVEVVRGRNALWVAIVTGAVALGTFLWGVFYRKAP